MKLRCMIWLLTPVFILVSLGDTGFSLNIGDKEGFYLARSRMTRAARKIKPKDGETSPPLQAEPDLVDAVSGATFTGQEKWLSLSGDSLKNMVNNKKGIYVLSTTNPDGTPYAAAILPPVFDSGHGITITSVPAGILENLNRNNSALLTIYAYDCFAEMHKGARMILKRDAGLSVQKETVKGMRAVYLRVEKILPLY